MDNLYIVDAITFPSETDAPLIVDANAMKPGPITLKGLQPVPWRDIQFFECGDRIDLDQFAHRNAGDLAPATANSCLEECSGLSFREAFDHIPAWYNECRYTASIIAQPRPSPPIPKSWSICGVWEKCPSNRIDTFQFP